ncbi:MAG TPA: trehalose-6-phosphate synthase [Terriglobales bacterium]
MRLFSLRLILSLIVAITLVSVLSVYKQVRGERRSLRADLERRAAVLADSLAGNVQPHLENGSTANLQQIVDRFSNREHLAGVAVFNQQLQLRAQSAGLSDRMPAAPAVATQAIATQQKQSAFLKISGRSLYVYAMPLNVEDSQHSGVLVIVHDATYIQDQTRRLWRETFFRVLVQVFLIVLITVLIVRWSIAAPITRVSQWLRALRVGRAEASALAIPDFDLLRPLAREMTSLAQSLTAARSAAEREAQLRQAGESSWTSERLSVHIRSKLGHSRLFVVSNREPYSHVRSGKSVQCVVPASGLVTALEPILRACDGTWIAHGSGDADRETVDHNDRLAVPPDEPRYTLRRVWLTKEEEEGYYYGFSNEGLWPLCHIAHTRPLFRADDWEHYRNTNIKFADAVLEELRDTRDPVLLVQDYHFAPLPRLIKKKRPDARVAIFWHIPWPNPEAFAICPWQRELLDGLLGADVIGFHIQAHCSNFLQSVDRTLECRIDWEHSAINRQGHRTVIKPFPISVDFPETRDLPSEPSSIYLDRAALLRELGVEGTFVGVGVDRVDYTKGIQERFLAIERMLEKRPTYQGKFVFVQIGAPSRTHIKRYHDLLADVEAEAERINWRFQTSTWKPIVFLKRHFSHKEITRYYRAADVCMVTALHDGMNLVAKEFIAARDDEQGVLVLSRFTGAARELLDSVLVNPYDIESTADAVCHALEMGPEERTARMQRLRKVVREQNIYRWAGNLVTDLCEVRLEGPEEYTAKGQAHAASQ